MKPETKSLSVEVKADPQGVIEAYASAFGPKDSYDDVVQRGAFAKTVAERGPAGSRKIKALFNHDSYHHPPVGVPQSLIEDSYGLMTVTKMSKTQLGQDIHILASEGALSELSIGFNEVKAEYPERSPDGIRRILTEVKLYEYSFVTFPANEDAIITGVKSMSDLEHEIKRWTAIAQVGMSAKAGRTLSGANAKKILSALQTLQDLLTAAGVDDAATSTSDDTTAAEKGNAEPHESKDAPHSSLLTALQLEAKRQNAEGRKAVLLGELRAFGQTLGA